MVSNHADYNNADYDKDNVNRPSAKDIMLATISSQIGTIENRGIEGETKERSSCPATGYAANVKEPSGRI